MRRPLRILGNLFFLAACTVVLLAAGLFVFERSGLLLREMEERLASSLGVETERVSIHSVSFSRFGMICEVSGVRVEPQADSSAENQAADSEAERLSTEAAQLWIDQLRVSFNPLLTHRRGLSLIEVQGARVVLGPGLWQAKPGKPNSTPQAWACERWPEVLVRDLDLVWRAPQQPETPLGTIDLRLDQMSWHTQLRGRLQVAAAEAGARTISLEGEIPHEGELELRLGASKLALSDTGLAQLPGLEALASTALQSKLSFRLATRVQRQRLPLKEAPPIEGWLLLDDGQVQHASMGRPVEAVQLFVEGSIEPSQIAKSNAAREANATEDLALGYNLRTAGRGRFDQAAFELQGLLGDAAPAHLKWSSSVRAINVDASATTLDSLGILEKIEKTWSSLGARGSASIGIDVVQRLEQDQPELLLEVRPGQDASIEYVGRVSKVTGKRIGFPMRLGHLSGAVVHLQLPYRERPGRLALIDLASRPPVADDGPLDASTTPSVQRGEDSSGSNVQRSEVDLVPSEQGSVTVLGEGLIYSPPLNAPHRSAEIDLIFEVSGVAADERLRKAVEGLPGTTWIWPTLNLGNGQIEGTFRLNRSSQLPRPTTHTHTSSQGMTLAWQKLPVPVSTSEFTLDLATTSRGELGLSYEAIGSTATCEHAHIRGRTFLEPDLEAIAAQAAEELEAAGQSDEPTSENSTTPTATPTKRPRPLESSLLAIDLRQASLAGSDIEIVRREMPALGKGLAIAGVAGKADLELRSVRQVPGASVNFEAQVTPRRVDLLPAVFPVPVRDTHGRVLVHTIDPRGSRAAKAAAAANNAEPAAPMTTVDLAPITGDWSGGARVAVFGSILPDQTSQYQLHAAGVRTSDRNLLAAVANSANSNGERTSNFGNLDLSGRVDASGSLSLKDGVPEANFFAHLRGNELKLPGDFKLSDLIGSVRVGSDGLRSNRLLAVLGNRPVEMRDVMLSAPGASEAPGDDPNQTTANSSSATEEQGGFELTADLSSPSLPLDREHLSWFVGEDTLAPLIDEFGWRGVVDLDSSRLKLTGLPSGELRLVFAGKLVLSDMFLKIGLPLRISSAVVDVRELRFEDGRLRVWAELEDLFGNIAGRRLDNARLLVTYLAPRFSILELDGQLEGGHVTGLQAGETLAGPTFSLDLKPPYDFELGANLEKVDVRGLLAGLFESTVENRGLLSAQVRLSGDLEHLIDMRGSGNAQIEKARLWSIPAVRGVLSTLGAEESATFDSVTGRFQLRDGVLKMSDLEVNSPLLNLVGFGTLDLDGRLDHELQVRYSLVDKLGPFTRLLYWVQNNLISIRVSGDMARPQVSFRGIWGFLQRRKQPKRRLPLPGFTPLPQHF